MNTQPLSPQGYNINDAPLNTNPFWEQEGGGNVPAGGTTGQVLTKRTDADYDTEWKTPEAGGVDWPEGGEDGDILVKAGNDAEWRTPDFVSSEDLAAVEDIANEAKNTAEDAQDAAIEEATRAQAAEAELTRKQNVTSQELNDYKIANNQTIADIRSGISQDKTAQAAKDAAQDAQIQQNATDLADYETENDAAVSQINRDVAALESSIDDETTARIDADTILRQDLTEAIQSETSQREAADVAIRALIADNSGDISEHGAIIQSLDTRTTTNENDIDALETSMENAEADIADLKTLRPVPEYKNQSTGLIEPSEPTDESGPVSTGQRNVLQMYYDYSAHKYRYRWGGITPFPSTDGWIIGGILRAYGSINDHSVITDEIAPTVQATGMQSSAKDTWGSIPIGGFIVKAQASISSRKTGKATDSIAGGTTGQVLTKDSDEDYDWSWQDAQGGSSYTLPPATETELGGIKVGTGLSVESDGTLSADGYTLPTATEETLGGVKIGDGLGINSSGAVYIPSAPQPNNITHNTTRFTGIPNLVQIADSSTLGLIDLATLPISGSTAPAGEYGRGIVMANTTQNIMINGEWSYQPSTAADPTYLSASHILFLLRKYLVQVSDDRSSSDNYTCERVEPDADSSITGGGTDLLVGSNYYSAINNANSSGLLLNIPVNGMRGNLVIKNKTNLDNYFEIVSDNTQLSKRIISSFSTTDSYGKAITPKYKSIIEIKATIGNTGAYCLLRSEFVPGLNISLVYPLVGYLSSGQTIKNAGYIKILSPYESSSSLDKQSVQVALSNNILSTYWIHNTAQTDIANCFYLDTEYVHITNY